MYIFHLTYNIVLNSGISYFFAELAHPKSSSKGSLLFDRRCDGDLEESSAALFGGR